MSLTALPWWNDSSFLEFRAEVMVQSLLVSDFAQHWLGVKSMKIVDCNCVPFWSNCVKRQVRGWPGDHPPVSWCQPRHCQPRGKLQGRGPCVGCLMSVSWDQNFDIQRRGSPVKIRTFTKTVLKIYLELPLETSRGAIKEEENQNKIKELPRWFSYYWMDKTKNFIYVGLYLSNWLNN